MKQSNIYIPMSKEVTNQAICKSHIYALKAGLITQVSAGIYAYLPMAVKILNNIEKIIREEIDNIGANEVVLPLLEPQELWEQTQRWQNYGSELFRVQDRKNTGFALGPTHEEVITDIVKNYLVSYKKYPLNLYQIGTKFRDEARPRFGLLRGREFIMFDGYSFHTSIESLMETYNDYYEAYCKILNRLGLDYRVVEADNGKIGGSSSHEFMVLADIGEDTIVYVDNEEKAYNIEVAPVYFEQKEIENPKDIEEIYTPNCSTIEELSKNDNIDASKLIKTLAFKKEDELILVMLCGNDELNETKLAKIIDVEELEFADNESLSKYGLVEGYMSPYKINNVRVLADNFVKNVGNMIMGANKKDYHLKNVNLTDFEKIEFYDLKNIKEGDYLTKELGPVKLTKGIEVGHIFALGDRYTKCMNVSYLSEKQKQETPLMGCYGIGVSRLLSAIIEQNHDENGMILPKEIAPYDVHILLLDPKNEIQNNLCQDIIQKLKENNIKYLIDDRQERPGIKFNESDLMGLPARVVIGKKANEKIVEFKYRNNDINEEIKIEEIIEKIK